MDALRLPPPEQDVKVLSGGERRRVALCRVLLKTRTCCCSTNRRTISTRTRWRGWSASWPSSPAPSWRSRTIATSSTTSQAGFWSWIAVTAFRGRQLLVVARSETEAAGGRKAGIGATKDAGARAGVGSSVSESASSQEQNAFGCLRRSAATIAGSAHRGRRDPIPPAPRLGDNVVIAERVQKALAIASCLKTCRSGCHAVASSVIGANGAGKSTLFRMIVGQEKRTRASSSSVRPSSWLTSIRAATRLAGDTTVWEEISGGVENFEMASAKLQSRAYVGQFGFRGSDQQKLVKKLSGGERNRVHLAKDATQRRKPAAARRDQPTIWMSIRCARSKKRCWLCGLRGGDQPRSLVPSTELRRTCWRLKATARWCGLKETVATTSKIAVDAWAKTPISRTV